MVHIEQQWRKLNDKIIIKKKLIKTCIYNISLTTIIKKTIAIEKK